MPTYSIEGPDGKTYSIDGPEGASRDQVIAEIKKRQQGDTSYAAEIGKGAARGPVGLAGDIAEIATFKGPREHIADFFSALRGGESKLTPGYGEQFEEKLGIEPSANASTWQAVAGSVAETLTNPVSWIGPENLGLKTLSAIGTGAGSELLGEAGEQIDPRLGVAGRLIGGAAGGAAPGTTTKVRANTAAAAKLRDEQELKTAADKSYAWLRDPANTVQMTPTSIEDLHATMIGDLGHNDADPITAPRTFALTHALRPGNVAIGDSKDILALHNKLGQVSAAAPENMADARAARIARDSLRDWMASNMPAGTSKRLQKAMGDWSHYEMIKDVRSSLEHAIHRAEVSGTNKNAINTMRQEIRKILDNDKRVRGFPKEAKDGLERIVSGTMLENFSRVAGKAVPYSSGFALISALAHSDWAGPLAGAAIGSYGFRKLGDFLTRRQIGQLVQILQEQAPSNKWRAGQNRAIARRVGPYPAAGATRGAIEAGEYPQGTESSGAMSNLGTDLENFAGGGLYGVIKGRGGGNAAGDAVASMVGSQAAQDALIGVGFPWSERELTLLKSLKAAGHTSREIADRLGKTEHAVDLKFNRMGLSRPPLAPRWTPQIDQKILSMARAGYSQRSIANETGFTVNQIDYRIKQLRHSGIVPARGTPSLPKLKFMEGAGPEDVLANPSGIPDELQ